MLNHYDCGRYLTLFSVFSPNRPRPSWIHTDCEITNAIQPKPFQLLMAFVARVEPSLGNLVFGLMSSGFILLIFFILKSVGTSDGRSLFTALLVGICPTLTWCFNYFLNETLMLFFLAAGLFFVACSLDTNLDPSKDFRLRSFSFWLLLFAALTKLVVLPVLVAWAFLFGKSVVQDAQKHKVSLLLQGAGLIACLFWFSLSTFHQTGFLNPFGKSLQSIIMRKLGSCGNSFTIVDDETQLAHSFATLTPICGQPFFGIEKLGAFVPVRQANPVTISLQWAPLRWDNEIAERMKAMTFHEKFSIWWQNLAAGLTTSSYPEVYRPLITNDHSLLLNQVSVGSSDIAIIPIFLILIFSLAIAVTDLLKNRPSFFSKTRPRWFTFLNLSIVLSWTAFLIQQEGVFEPRYRKGLDLLSLLALSHFFTLRKNRNEKLASKQ